MLVVLSIVPALLYPLIWVVYRRRLSQKRKDLEGILSTGNGVKKYRDAFGLDPNQLFTNSFSLFIYAVPIAINSLALWILTAIFFERHELHIVGAPALQAFAVRLPRSVMLAFIGAFVWGMYEALRRYRGLSLSPESLHFIWVRMLIGGTLAPVVSSVGATLFAGGFNDFIAFGLGAMPVKTLSDWIQGQVTTRLQVSTSPTEPPTLQSLQGATASGLDTLSEADIDNTQELAYSDPLKLFLRTNIPWKVILDLIDQALLFNYVGEKAKSLRTLGIRGAIEFAALYEPLHPAAPSAAASGNINIVVARIAELLGEQVDVVLNLIDTLRADFQVQFLTSLWDGAYGSDVSERGGRSGGQSGAGGTSERVMPAPDPKDVSIGSQVEGQPT